MSVQFISLLMKQLQIQSAPIVPRKHKLALTEELIFFVHGVASLIGWFVVLNSLDYFHYVYSRYDVYSYFLLPLLVGYLLTAVVFRKVTRRIAMPRLINLGIIVSCISLFALLLVSLMFRNHPGLGFYLSVLICLVIGISGNAVQLSYFSMINFVSERVISRFTIGTAVSGLGLNIIRMITVAIAGAKAHSALPIMAYFIVAAVVFFIDIYLNTLFCRSDVYKEKIQPFLNQDEQIKQNLTDTGETQLIKRSYFQLLWQANKVIYPYPIIILANFTLTMMIFPDLTIKIEFPFSKVWSGLIFILLFGLGDMIGKFLIQVKGSFNAKSNKYLIFSRLVFLFLIPLMASGRASNDPLIHNNFFPFFVIFLFGLSNGFVVSSSFILSFKKCPKQWKNHAGVLCGIVLQIGLTLGIILGIPMQMIAQD